MRVAWPRGGACSSASGRLPTAPPAAAAATRRAAAAGPGPASGGVHPCRRSKRTARVHTRAWCHRQHNQSVGVVTGGACQQTWRATLHRHRGRHQAADIYSGPHAWIPRRAIGSRHLQRPPLVDTAPRHRKQPPLVLTCRRLHRRRSRHRRQHVRPNVVARHKHQRRFILGVGRWSVTLAASRTATATLWLPYETPMLGHAAHIYRYRHPCRPRLPPQRPPPALLQARRGPPARHPSTPFVALHSVACTAATAAMGAPAAPAHPLLSAKTMKPSLTGPSPSPPPPRQRRRRPRSPPHTGARRRERCPPSPCEVSPADGEGGGGGWWRGQTGGRESTRSARSRPANTSGASAGGDGRSGGAASSVRDGEGAGESGTKRSTGGGGEAVDGNQRAARRSDRGRRRGSGRGRVDAATLLSKRRVVHDQTCAPVKCLPACLRGPRVGSPPPDTRSCSTAMDA